MTTPHLKNGNFLYPQLLSIMAILSWNPHYVIIGKPFFMTLIFADIDCNINFPVIFN